MGKLIFIVFVVILAYWIIKRGKHAKTKNDAFPDSIEDMVRCANCGTHFPKSEGITSQGKFFCSDDHYRQHKIL